MGNVGELSGDCGELWGDFAGTGRGNLGGIVGELWWNGGGIVGELVGNCGGIATSEK